MSCILYFFSYLESNEMSKVLLRSKSGENTRSSIGPVRSISGFLPRSVRFRNDLSLPSSIAFRGDNGVCFVALLARSLDWLCSLIYFKVVSSFIYVFALSTYLYSRCAPYQHTLLFIIYCLNLIFPSTSSWQYLGDSYDIVRSSYSPAVLSSCGKTQQFFLLPPLSVVVIDPTLFRLWVLLSWTSSYISTSLLTTVSGLLVALPSFTSFRCCVRFMKFSRPLCHMCFAGITTWDGAGISLYKSLFL